MSDFYAKLAAGASELLGDKGQTFTFRRVAGRVIDPITGAVTPGATTTHSAPGVMTSLKKDFIEGAMVEQGDRQFIIDSSFEPEPTDKVIFDSEEWRIAAIEPVSPGGVPLIYKIQARR